MHAAGRRQWLRRASTLGLAGVLPAAHAVAGAGAGADHPPATDAAASGRLAPWGRRPTPTLRGTDLEGRVWGLGDFAGQVLLLNFWASYCAPCQLEMPALNRLQARFAARGLRVAGLNHGEMPERVRLFLARVPFDGQVLLDRSQGQLKAWGAYALPTNILIDRQGRARLWHMGELDWDAAPIQAQVQALLAA